MRQSKLFTKTRKEAPADETAKNAQLLIRAGYVHKEMAGVYAWLPLGLRVRNNIEQVVQEEMNAIGCQELIMTNLQRKELWEETDRWDDEKVDIWFKSELKAGGEVGLAWSHEEPIGNMMKSYISSYKDLPIYVYQFQNKLRNEMRAKSGVMRGREFIMKDAYSFCRGEEDHDAIYEAMKVAYMKVFDRLGIGEQTFITFASGGAFTAYSHEFQTLCEAGEDVLFQIPDTDEYYNQEVVAAQAPALPETNEEMRDVEEFLGEGMIGVEEVAKHINIPVEKTTKTILFQANDNRVIAVAVRGGYDVDEEKVKNVAKCETLALLAPERVQEVTGAVVGYVGMINLPEEVEQYWDESTKGRMNFEMGMNKTNYHMNNLNFGRGLPEPETFYDLKVAREGDIHPESGKPYVVHKAAEVGNIFNFGRQKAEDLGLNFKDDNGESVAVWMGSYGIGVTRLVGVLVEMFADEKGIVWPEEVAPYQVHLVGLNLDDEELRDYADGVYSSLTRRGVDVLYDDRIEARPGEKFADSDLIGIPYRVVVSKKTREEGKFEVVTRKDGEVRFLSEEELYADFVIS